MISPGLEIRLVELIFHTGLSQREIAAETGVGKNTIRAIRSGERAPDYSRTRAKQRAERKAERPQSRQFWPPSDASYERCPGCGGMVVMPCLACRVAARRQRRVFASPGPELGFDLRGEEAARLKEVQGWPRRFGDPQAAGIAEDRGEREPTDEELAMLEHQE